MPELKPQSALNCIFSFAILLLLYLVVFCTADTVTVNKKIDHSYSEHCALYDRYMRYTSSIQRDCEEQSISTMIALIKIHEEQEQIKIRLNELTNSVSTLLPNGYVIPKQKSMDDNGIENLLNAD